MWNCRWSDVFFGVRFFFNVVTKSATGSMTMF